ncbi:precorrin-3B C(17)-methyltransferase [Leptospira broomii serovar Hurstbridge str. 5399]|uniref:Precorrin-3B C(17)-methyltransferase n=1 Tax=Leptospira broomii serovar Hurstbridge str. 5399 TaxID=1049789 RepID=T0FD70_9LEPT|nr:precorrin-3B C(17)-methyltransferase [Leptospira broomii]EQA45821.1 precorrin-3B C(17)-methyltransferase [Leptospira broomii serovar Hurstbridge str. 5399]
MKYGKLNLVGIGPGRDEHITPAALEAIHEAEYVIGYSTYIGLVRHLLTGKQVTRTGMTEEIGRAQAAVEAAADGKKVALISSGDAGVYGMAGLVFEVLRKIGWKRGDSPEIRIFPGISADNSCASLVGAPLVHDSCRISLSDLLTPWPIIEKRIDSAARGDFVISLYNPASGRRQRQILEATRIIGQYRPGNTPVALIKSAYRKQQSVVLSDLDHFLDFEIGMNTTVIIGSSNSFIYEGFFVTPRGYSNKYSLKSGEVQNGQRKGFSLRTEGDLSEKSNTPDGERTLNITKISNAFVRADTSVLEPEEPIIEDKNLERFERDSSVASALNALRFVQSVKSSPTKTLIPGEEIKDFGKIGRLAGALLYESKEEYYLIGKLKRPCQFEDFGFSYAEEHTRWTKLNVADLNLARTNSFQFLVPSKTTPDDLYERFAVHRNSSISERITALLEDSSDKVIWNQSEYWDLSWLPSLPKPIWTIVRDEVLKCS